MTGTAVFAQSQSGIGISAQAPLGQFAGFFNGDVEVHGDVSIFGSLSKFGGGFTIDHPLSPTEKYLNHSFVESSERKNFYDGVVELDLNGEATVELPAWFQALNREFRYQLTAIGAPAPNLHISETVRDDRFSIAGGESRQSVCWQITAVRADAWAQANGLLVESEKANGDRGRYLHRDVRGAATE
jgi:hypothetical protein